MAGTYEPNEFVLHGGRKHIDKGGGIQIASYVWIGTGVLILAGVNIYASHIIIGAGSVVTHNITEEYAIYAGNPAKLIRRINKPI